MDRRLKLDAELRELLQEILGYVNIYYQPNEAVHMKYDCIIYKQQTMAVRRANNRTYYLRAQYEVTVVTRDPDSPLPRALQEHFQLCAPGRKFMADNLYHFPFTIFY